MSKQINCIVGVALTINRPDGSVERVENTRFKGSVPPVTYRAMVKATKEAGRGDIVKCEPLYKMMDEPQPSAMDIARADDAAHRAMVERVSATGR